MAPFVKKSFDKHFVIAIAKQSDDFINLNIDSLEPEELDEWIDNNKKKYLNSLNLKEENIYIDNKDNLDSYLYQSALFDLYKEGTQAAQALYHNLNTLQSRSGNQLPFSSINYGTCTELEGRMVTKALLEVSMEGLGKNGVTSIFPCGIFQIKKGINFKPGYPNYDLKRLALKSTTMRIYPNYANCDWSNQVNWFKADRKQKQEYIDSLDKESYNNLVKRLEENPELQEKIGLYIEDK